MYQSFKIKRKYEDNIEDEHDFQNNDEKKVSIKDLIGGKENIILYILSVLVSRIGLAAGINPFGFAMFGAISNLQIPLLIVWVLNGLVTLLAFGPLACVKFAIASILFILLKAFIKSKNTNFTATVRIICTSLIAEAIVLAFLKPMLYDIMLSIFASIITAVFYVIFSAGIPVIMEIHKKRVFESEGLAAAGIILAIAISGIGNLSVFNISIRGILCVLIVLMLGWKRGAAVGAASGITIGLILGLIGIGTPATIATYGLGGLLAGIFSRYGKLGVVAGFILGNILLTFYANGSTEVIISLKEIIVASVCLFLVPKKFDVILDGLFDYNRALPEVGNLSIDTSTIYRLNAVSEVVDNMARTAYDNANTNEQSVTTDEVSVFIKTLNDNTCKRCTNYAKCWEANYHNMYETIFNSIEVLQNIGEITREDLKGAECENKELLVDGLNFCYQIYKVNQNWQQKMREKRAQVSKQLKGVSEAINKLASDISVGRSAELLEEREVEELFALEIGLSSTKKNRSEMSGDTSTYTKLQDGKYLIGLSDGMGSGKEAKKNSRAVIELLSKLLNTGFDKDMAIELVNSVMLLKQEDDMYATLDVAIFDSVSGNTEFIKVSACPTFIKKGENIDIIKSLTLPVGTLENIDIDLYDKSLEKDDLIVMVTDGILESRQDLEQKEMWIVGLLKNINTNNPQRIADIILQEAVDNGFGVPVDDMTVIVSKVKSLIDAKN